LFGSGSCGTGRKATKKDTGWFAIQNVAERIVRRKESIIEKQKRRPSNPRPRAPSPKPLSVSILGPPKSATLLNGREKIPLCESKLYISNVLERPRSGLTTRFAATPCI
jgi:hypothetical protein